MINRVLINKFYVRLYVLFIVCQDEVIICKTLHPAYKLLGLMVYETFHILMAVFMVPFENGQYKFYRMTLQSY